MKRTSLVLGACVLAGVFAYLFKPITPTEGGVSSTQSQGGSMVAVKMPVIEGNAAIGQRIFEKTCATCHGLAGGGIEGAGPPLIHIIYEPGHHGDESFQRAVALGVKSHHWGFGDMPPIEGLTRGDVAMIIAYIRDVQLANGIN
jgi:hypothetical protein